MVLNWICNVCLFSIYSHPKVDTLFHMFLSWTSKGWFCPVSTPTFSDLNDWDGKAGPSLIVFMFLGNMEISALKLWHFQGRAQLLFWHLVPRHCCSGHQRQQWVTTKSKGILATGPWHRSWSFMTCLSDKQCEHAVKSCFCCNQNGDWHFRIF